MILPLFFTDDFTLASVAIIFGYVFMLHLSQTVGYEIFEFSFIHCAIKLDAIFNKFSSLSKSNLLVLLLLIKLDHTEDLRAKHFADSILQPFRLILGIAEASLDEFFTTLLIRRLALDPRIILFVADCLPNALFEVRLLRCFAEHCFDLFATTLKLRL